MFGACLGHHLGLSLACLGHILKACLGQSKISAVLHASMMPFYSNAALRGSHGLSAQRTKSSRLEGPPARSVISNTKIDATSLSFEFAWVSLPSSESAFCVEQRSRG